MTASSTLPPENSARIRPVQPADKAEWLRLRAALWLHETTLADLENELETILADQDRQPVFVAEKPGGGLCGMIEASLHKNAPGAVSSPVGYLEGWYVDPDWRGKGIGRQLAMAAENWAREKGCREMASDTDSNYPLSPAVHVALGYEETLRVIHYLKKLE